MISTPQGGGTSASEPAHKRTLVFCIGDSRTGTTSFHEHAEQLGWNSIHYYTHIFLTATGDPIPENEKLRVLLDFVRTSGFDCFSDYPTRLFYRELAEAFPDALFVNTVRSLDAWLTSCRTYFGNAGRNVDYTQMQASHIRLENAIENFFHDSDRYLKINICEDDPFTVSETLNKFLLGYDPGLVIGKANQSRQSHFKGVASMSDSGTMAVEQPPTTIRLVPPREQFGFYNYAVSTLHELVACLGRRKQQAVLSERGHAFLVNDTSGGFQGIVLGQLEKTDSLLELFGQQRERLAASGCSYTVFIVPDKVTLATHLLPKCFDPFAETIATNIATRRLASHIGDKLGFVYDMAPYLDSVNEFASLVFRFDSHLNHLGCYHLAMAMSEILTSTLPGCVDPIPRGIWSCKVGTWRGDLLKHLAKVEMDMLRHVWARNTCLLAIGPGCPPPNEQFLHYFMPNAEKHVRHTVDATLQALHPNHPQSKYTRVRRSPSGQEKTLLFVHGSSIDKVFEPLSMMADTTYFYLNQQLLPPEAHPSPRPGTHVVQVIEERFLYR